MITLIYNGNGNTGGGVPVDTNSYTQGGNVRILDNAGNLTRTGYTFAGWNTQSDGGGVSYLPGQLFTISGTSGSSGSIVSIYPIEEEEYTKYNSITVEWVTGTSGTSGGNKPTSGEIYNVNYYCNYYRTISNEEVIRGTSGTSGTSGTPYDLLSNIPISINNIGGYSNQDYRIYIGTSGTTGGVEWIDGKNRPVPNDAYYVTYFCPYSKLISNEAVLRNLTYSGTSGTSGTTFEYPAIDFLANVPVVTVDITGYIPYDPITGIGDYIVHSDRIEWVWSGSRPTGVYYITYSYYDNLHIQVNITKFSHPDFMGVEIGKNRVDIVAILPGPNEIKMLEIGLPNDSSWKATWESGIKEDGRLISCTQVPSIPAILHDYYVNPTDPDPDGYVSYEGEYTINTKGTIVINTSMIGSLLTVKYYWIGRD